MSVGLIWGVSTRFPALQRWGAVAVLFCVSIAGKINSRRLSDGVMVAQSSLEALVMVRIHVGQPLDLPHIHNGFLLFTGKTIRQLRLGEKAKKRPKRKNLLTLLLTLSQTVWQTSLNCGDETEHLFLLLALFKFLHKTATKTCDFLFRIQ